MFRLVLLLVVAVGLGAGAAACGSGGTDVGQERAAAVTSVAGKGDGEVPRSGGSRKTGTGPRETRVPESGRGAEAPPTLFDPCTLNPEVIRAAGFDPEQVRNGKVGPQAYCTWGGLDVLSVLAVGTYQMRPESRQSAPDPLVDPTWRSFGGRQVISGHIEGAGNPTCESVIARPRGGSVAITVEDWSGRTRSESVCTFYRDVTDEILRELISVGEA